MARWGVKNQFWLLCLVPVLCWAEEISWPEPLSLEFALSRAPTEHPQLQIVAAELDHAKAVQSQVQADTGFSATLSARLRWVEPQPVNVDQSSEDHRLSLSVDKPLYDFGRSEAKETASLAAVEGQALVYQDTLARRRIAIMAAFFDVLLADQAYARDMEEMSMTYVRFDRARHRNELGKLSDIELLEKESEFQASRVKQAQSVALQRTTRAHLANLLNRPENLPSELVEPKLDFSARKIPEGIEAWFAEMEESNRSLLSAKAQQASAKAQLEVAQSYDNPQLNGHVEVSEYSREYGANDKWRAGVTLDVPLFTGGRSDALRARQRAVLQKATANLEQQRRVLRQELLELWTQLQTLNIAQQRLAVERDFRDLYLDRSRAEYELEVTTDLGDSMVRISALRYRTMKTKFSTALAWARVDAMLGRGEALASRETENMNKGEK